MKVITEVTYSDLQPNHIVLDPAGDEWIIDERRDGWVDGVLTIAIRIRRYDQRTWIKGAFAEPIPIIDQTTGDSVETVGRILAGHVVLEPITGRNARPMMIAHLRHHHRAGVTGAKTDGTLKELHAYHASLHTPVSQPGSLPHVHKELT